MRARTCARFLTATTLAGVTAIAGVVPAARSAPLANTAGPRATATAAPVDSRAADVARLTQARDVLAAVRPLNVSVLGDSVGNDPGEWVSKWAEGLGTDRVVVVRHFDWKAVRWQPTPEIFAPDTDPAKAQLTVWNFGWSGGTPQRAAQHLRVGVPVKPDLALIAFGHNVGPAAVPAQYSSLQSALTARWGTVPTVTTLAHMTPVVRPGQAQARVRLLQWLQARRLPYLDLRAVFDPLPSPRDAFVDAVHPNQLGYRMISNLVESSLSPGRRVAPVVTVFRPVARRAALVGYAQSVGNRTTTIRVTYAFRDGFGRPMAHAWVRLRWAGPRGSTPDAETDAAGRVTATLRIASGSTRSLSATVTDGFTTLSTGATTVRAR